uniref:Big defensin n=1 Tax=Mimachlamys nobilis TaxID=106276 RepID=A0A1B2FQD4_MIMNO|nr:big defensin [Mimachlamys nobilis]
MTFPRRVRCYSMIYMSLMLMAILCPVCPASVPERVRTRQKRALPAIYLGAVVSQQVFNYLVAAYGAAVVAAAGVKIANRIRAASRNRDNHSCRGNSGWCRPKCARYEREYTANLGVCGRNKCCIPK